MGVEMNGNTANFFLVILLGVFGLLWRLNVTLERMQGFVHENHNIAKRLEGLAEDTNGRVGKVERRQSWQQGALAALGAVTTLGIAIAGVILLEVR